jgi:glycosyltransferase involved in cell wall biosynthesis
MNILIVTNHFWPENFNINILARDLTARGHHVTVLAGIPNYPQGKFFPGYGILKKRVDDYQGIKVAHVPIIPRGKGNNLRLILNYLSFVVSGCLLAPFYCRAKYEIIFVYETSPITVGLPALVLKKLKDSLIVFWVQDLWPESLAATGAVKSNVVLNLVGVLVRLIYRGCDILLAQSKAFLPSIARFGGKPGQVVYYPNTTEDFYQPVCLEANAPERLLVPSGFCLMFAGNIGAAQDFDNILAAMEIIKDYPDIHLVILGDGRRRDWVQAQVQQRGLEQTVHLLGRYPPETMPRFFALATSMLVTLRKEPIFSLTIPSKVQSYLACGKPIIAALDGEGARIIEEAGAGLTCPAGSSADLAEVIIKMYRMSPLDRQVMGTRGRSYFERHFERKMLLDRLEELMAKLRLNKEQLSRA